MQDYLLAVFFTFGNQPVFESLGSDQNEILADNSTFKIFDGFLMRVDNAFSREGWRFIWTFDELFGRTKRW